MRCFSVFFFAACIVLDIISASKKVQVIKLDFENDSEEHLAKSIQTIFSKPFEVLIIDYLAFLDSEGSVLDNIILAKQTRYLSEPFSSSLSEYLIACLLDRLKECNMYLLSKKKLDPGRSVFDVEVELVPNLLFDCYIRDLVLPEKILLVFTQFMYQFSPMNEKYQETFEWLFGQLQFSQQILLFKKYMEKLELTKLTCPILYIPVNGSEKDISLAKSVLNNLLSNQNLDPVKMKIVLMSAMSSKFGSEFYASIHDNFHMIKEKSHQFFEFANSMVLNSSCDIESSLLFSDILAYLSEESLSSNLDITFYVGYGRILNALLENRSEYYVKIIQDHPSPSSLLTSIEAFTAFEKTWSLFDSILTTEISFHNLQTLLDSDEDHIIEYSKFHPKKYHEALHLIKVHFNTLMEGAASVAIDQFKLAVLELHWILKNTTHTIYLFQKYFYSLLGVFQVHINSFQIDKKDDMKRELSPYINIFEEYLQNTKERFLILTSFEQFKCLVDFLKFASNDPVNEINDFIMYQLSFSVAKEPIIYERMIEYTIELDIFDVNLFVHVQLLRFLRLLICKEKESAMNHFRSIQLFFEYLIKHQILNSVQIKLFQVVMKKIEEKINSFSF